MATTYEVVPYPTRRSGLRWEVHKLRDGKVVRASAETFDTWREAENYAERCRSGAITFREFTL